MSAEVTSVDLDARRRARSVDGTLREADALLETTFAELSDALRRAAEGTGDGGPPTRCATCPGTTPARWASTSSASSPTGPATTASGCGPVLAHWGWAVAGGRARHPRRSSCGWPRRSSCCTSSPSSRTT